MIKQQPLPPSEHFIPARQPGLKGLSTIIDAHDISYQESPDLLNVYFDFGVIGPRQGSTLFANKPTSETGTPLQVMIVRDSTATEFLIAAYYTAPSTVHFYVWDTTNSYWLPINGSYISTFTITSTFGYQGWIAGRGDDRLYFCNGTDDVCRWRVSLDHLTANALASDTSLTISDGTKFNSASSTVASVASNTLTLNSSIYLPTGQLVYYTTTGSPIIGLTNNTLYYAIPTLLNTGTTFKLAATLADAKAGNAIILSGSGSGTQTLYSAHPIAVYDGSVATNAVYYNKTSTSLSLTATLGKTYGIGSAVVSTITDRVSVYKGKIMNRWQVRLITANASPGSESTVNFSRISDPEDFINDPNAVASGTSQGFIDGFGPITDVKEFGEFIIVSKNDVSYRFDFVLNDQLSSQLSQVTPIISGKDMGPVSNQSSVKALNAIWFPTLSNGFIQLSPVATGVTSTTGISIISQTINNYLQTNINYVLTRGTYFNNKLIWIASTGAAPNLLLVYDTIRAAWTRWDGWNPTDIFVWNSKLYFLSAIDGKIYQGLSGYTDNNNPYTAYFYTKLDNYGESAMPKTMDAIYVEGYMTQNTTLYADVLFNEKGGLVTKTYRMNIQTPNFSFKQIQLAPLGSFPFMEIILDSLAPSQLAGFGIFRCYLSVPNQWGFYVVQIKFYSKDADSIWYLTGHAANPQLEQIIPPLLRIDSIN